MRALGFLSVLVVLAMVGCKSNRTITPTPPVVLNNEHNVTTRIVERVRIDTVKVEVSVPTERTEVRVPDTVSVVETSVARSWAWVHPDGTLTHGIENKDTELSTDAYVPTTETSIEVGDSVREQTPVYVPQPYPVERELTAWQQFRLSAFWWLVSACGLSIGIIFRKKLRLLLLGYICH